MFPSTHARLPLIAITMIAMFATTAAAADPIGKSADMELRVVSDLPTAKELPTWDGKGKVFVEQAVLLTQDELDSAERKTEPNGQDAIVLTLTPAGATIFAKLTEWNVGLKLAIIVDGKVVIAPVIKEKIGDGKANITMGNSTDSDAVFGALTRP